MVAGGEVGVEEGAGGEFDEAGGGAVGAGDPGAVGDGAVDDEVDAGGFGEDGAQDGGRADGDAGELPELLRGGEGHTRDPEGGAEFTRHEGLVVRHDVEVEFGLLAVAHKHGLDDVHADLAGNVQAVLHGDARVGIDARKGDPEPRESLVHRFLQRGGGHGGRRGKQLAHIERPGEQQRAELRDAAGEAVIRRRAHRPVAPAHGDPRDAAVLRGAHIRPGIPDQDRALAGSPRQAQHLAHDLRIRLEGETLAVAENGGERHIGEELPDQVLRPRLELVGRHRQRDTGFVQVPEQLRHPGVGPGMRVDVRGIICLEIGQRRIHEALVRLQLRRQGARDEVADAVPHEAAVFREAVQREAALAQRVVDGLGEVFQGIDQGAVQVEKDQFVGEFHGQNHLRSAKVMISSRFLRPPRPGIPRNLRIFVKTHRMKRYCQTLTLVDDEEMVAKYLEAHRHVWPEVIAGQREVGITDMQIYRHGLQLFMIMDTVDDFDFERDMARLATLPRQAEWEAYVSRFQGCAEGARSDEKWMRMERIF